MGHAYASCVYATEFFDRNDPERYKWLGHGTRWNNPKGLKWLGDGGFAEFIKATLSFVAAFERGEHVKAVLYEIGRALEGHIDVQAKKVFGFVAGGNKLEGAMKAAKFFALTSTRARASVEAFMVLNCREKLLCKDTLAIIAKLIWAARLDEAKEEASSRAKRGSRRK